MDSQLLKGFLRHTLSMPADFTPYEIQCSNGISIIHHDIGILEVIPSHSNISLVVSSGIHGDETAPLELIDEIVNDILKQKLHPNIRILFIIAHPHAINLEQRFISENLNRCFYKDNSNETEESRIAHRLQEHVSAFFSKSSLNDKKWHFDLHSAIRDSLNPVFAVVPASTQKVDVRPLISFCHLAKLDCVMFSQRPSYTFSWWTSETFSSLSATIEMGRVAPLYQNDMKVFMPLNEAIKKLISGFSLPQNKDGNAVLMYEISHTMTKNEDSFRFAFSQDIANFTYFSEGQILAEEKEVVYVADKGGEAVVFPNENVEKGQRACLLVQPIHPDLSHPFYVNV